MNKHQTIVGEIFREYKDISNVVGIVNFGSTAVGKERPDSDVDIYIVFNGGVKWELFAKKIRGVHIDFEVVSIKEFEKYTLKYPYLYYFEHDKILLDETGRVQKVFDRLNKYFSENNEVLKFWRNEYKIMRDKKANGGKGRHFAEVCDDAERKFSSHHSVKRRILTKKWFNEHQGKVKK